MHSERDEQRHHEVRIHINQHPYHSPNPTKGSELAKLANIPENEVLFREACGDHEDKMISPGETLHLHEDEHLYSRIPAQTHYSIVVNGTGKIVQKPKLSFEEVVRLAFPTSSNEATTTYTVIYRNGPKENPQGSMTPGQIVEIKDRMIFDVTATNKS